MTVMQSPSVPWKVLSSVVGAGILTEGWHLAEAVADPSPEESRSFIVEVAFASPFTSIPVVHLGLTGFDMDQRDSGRLTLKVESITPDGFTASVSTWSATRLYAVEFNWMAIGA